MLTRPSTRLLATVTVAGACCVPLATPASAAPCEGYSGVCAETPTAPPRTVVGGITDERPGLAATGSEIALLSLISLGSLSAGAGLVVAGRRRTASRAAS